MLGSRKQCAGDGSVPLRVCSNPVVAHVGHGWCGNAWYWLCREHADAAKARNPWLTVREARSDGA